MPAMPSIFDLNSSEEMMYAELLMGQVQSFQFQRLSFENFFPSDMMLRVAHKLIPCYYF